MPFNGSGVFSRVYSWVTDKNNSINITASRMDTEDTGFATGLSLCLTKDGQQIAAANLPMGGFAHTGVANATLTNQYAVVNQIQNSSFTWVAAGGTSDAITAVYSPAITSLVDGMELDFRASAANTTTTPTFSPSGLTAHTITKKGGAALVANDIAGAAFEAKLRYNLANTRWELLNPSSTIPFSDATALVKNSSDATKLLLLSAASITTGTTRTLTAQDKSYTIADNADFAAKAPLANPTFTGTPAAPTASSNTSTTQIATTAFVNPANSIGTSGYQEFASGLIIQWGTISTSGSGFTNITFPLTFPNAVFIVNATFNAAVTNDLEGPVVNMASATTSVCPVATVSTGGAPTAKSVTWVAIGH